MTIAQAADPVSTPAETQAETLAVDPDDDPLNAQIRAALKTVYDPEIPVDIYELGLIYTVAVAEDGGVAITMSLTAPGCPAAGELPGEVEHAVSKVEGVTGVSVEVVWDPPWDPSRMSDEAKLALNMY